METQLLTSKPAEQREQKDRGGDPQKSAGDIYVSLRSIVLVVKSKLKISGNDKN